MTRAGGAAAGSRGASRPRSSASWQSSRGSSSVDGSSSCPTIAEYWTTVQIYLAAFFLVLFQVSARTSVTTFFYQVARVEGQAMAPTLNDQDRLVVSKWPYHNHDPRLGDIVMLRYPLAPEKSFVKRMIGREGDAVRVSTARSS